ncbi:hypothetical protein RG47T_4262 [Mucilaginibacter polytrichastri]|uniref:Uncharacterized protein n=1 Tax=Mucilaginibacter polytrichastri TaxID=1302689 RepID=A0A1Q6A446_9SPHI|nr:hypothetical protein RG47T_4262 [Mucilaginibacter polytrichastri]
MALKEALARKILTIIAHGVTKERHNNSATEHRNRLMM